MKLKDIISFEKLSTEEIKMLRKELRDLLMEASLELKIRELNTTPKDELRWTSAEQNYLLYLTLIYIEFFSYLSNKIVSPFSRLFFTSTTLWFEDPLHFNVGLCNSSTYLPSTKTST